MSYKDLEAEIKAWANLEAHAKAKKEDAQEARRQAKRNKRAIKQGKGPLIAKQPAPKLDKPLKTYKRITIECRPIHHRKWGEPIELTYEVQALTDAVAEVAAIKQAREDGYSFDKVVHVTTFEK
ncbi:hypothetical protein D3C81_1637590 [compost metagenome]